MLNGYPRSSPHFILTLGVTQREMVPLSARHGRLIIVIDGKSRLRTFNLDHSLGGNGPRARLSISDLRDMVHTLAGVDSSEAKVMSIINGWKNEYSAINLLLIWAV